ncbi:MAG TPA: sodium:solute symporter [Thermoanaerobaculia bacterium]|nr:sodium:solute symporter [Thermoanaerobaculia bacterium]
MSTLDWAVLVAAIAAVVAYGIWKARASHDMDGFMVASRTLPWYAVALSIMATQASAITFLSTPGQAYADGMRFIQIYLGLPIAMVVLSITAVPLYHRLKVYTAYEFLESRFDLKTRCLAAFLFLVQRGLAAGLTIFAPSLILSTILGWSLFWTNLALGSFVVIYTAAGGSRAVEWTHVQQMLVIFFGLFVAFGMVVANLPDDVSLLDATRVAGSQGRLNAIDFEFDLQNRYNIWSGLLGGLFLSLSYFGTDQSQVQRYLTGRSVKQSRLGLLVNGMAKVPMQFFILFLGAMVFVFYQFTEPPVFFNRVATKAIESSPQAADWRALEERHGDAFAEKQERMKELVQAMRGGDAGVEAGARDLVDAADQRVQEIRAEAIELLRRNDPQMDPSDTNYVFLSFVIDYLPSGVVGLLIVMIFFASMNSTSSELNALASTTVVDIYRRLVRTSASDRHYLTVARLSTVVWGLFAISFAQYASRLGSLVEAVNILGSIFYGTILGIFLLAFYAKGLSGTATFLAAVVAEAAVVACFLGTEISFLWYNVVGSGVVVLAAPLFELALRRRRRAV